MRRCTILREAGLLDEFFVFLQEIGMMTVLDRLELPGVQRMLVPTVQFVLLYLLKVLFGGQPMNQLPSWLFSHIALMELVGFNARQVEEGLTQRKTKKKQGPLSPECRADTISKLNREQMESLFNHMLQCVVGCGRLDGERLAALDESLLETPKTYEGCGKLKQTRRVKVKGQKERATEEDDVYGWKVVVLIDVHTRLPLASDLSSRSRSMKGAGWCRSWSRCSAILAREDTSVPSSSIAALSTDRICGRCTSRE